MADDRRTEPADILAVARSALGEILAALAATGYTLLGPQVRNNTIVYDEFDNVAQLPSGFVTEQAPGHFRLKHGPGTRIFDFIPAAPSWKQFLFPPRQELLRLRKNGKEWAVAGALPPARSAAFIGVRPCELAAIQIQDRVFLREDYADATYRDRRNRVFILAVDCLRPADTCFCATMGTGPSADSGFDLSLTELDKHFLVRIGSTLGRDIMRRIRSEPASAFQLGASHRAIQEAAARATCEIEPATCAEDMLASLESPHWAEVARRCLSCGNCTLACPTCFCWDALDHTNIEATETSRERVWDSCFNPGFSYQAGGNIRPSISSRYRQWLSHKFGSWKEQYGVLGCVGCGRCITWCPAGIDTRLEVATLQREAKR